jgi:hypothetical protein
MQRHYRTILPFLIGMLLASFATSIKYPCPPLPDDPDSSCVAFHKAILHPADLASNMQGSMGRFVANLLLGFVIVFVLLTTVNALRTRRTAN